MITIDEIISICKFNKAHGINGELSATITAPQVVLDNCSCIVCDIDGIFVPFFIKDYRIKSQETFLLSIDDINNEQEAAMLVNKDIYVKRNEYGDALDDEDQVPIDFFIGFKYAFFWRNCEKVFFPNHFEFVLVIKIVDGPMISDWE